MVMTLLASGWHVRLQSVQTEHVPLEAVSLLRALVAPQPAALAEWLAAQALDAPGCRWLEAQGLAAYTFDRLQAAGLLKRLPGEVAATLQGAYYRAAADTLLHTGELGDVLRALAAAGVEPILFKGAALAFTVYPDPACRPMGDLDLWLTAEEMSRAQAALESLGYTQHIKSARPVALQARRGGEIQLVGRRPGSGLVELHWGVFAGEWLRRTAAVDEVGVRGRSVPLRLLDPPARSLAPEDGIIQLAAHLAINHQFAYPWVRGLVDVALLAQAQRVDWAVVAERARAWRVGTTTWLVLHLASDMLGMDETVPMLKRLAPSALRRGLLSLLADRKALLAMHDLTRGPARFLLQLLLVDRGRDAVRLIGRALWPEEPWLVARYGAATPAVHVRHLLAALRGRV